MSRGGQKMIPPALCGHVTSPYTTTSDTTASVTVAPFTTAGINGVIAAGDLLVLIHVVDSDATGVGTPNTVGNPWQPVQKPDGTPLNETQSGPTGTVRLRAWAKRATAAEAATASTYTITNGFAARHGLVVRIVPGTAIGPDPLPLTVAVRQAATGRAWCPDLPLPDAAGAFRDTGLLGTVLAYPHQIGKGVFTNGTRPSSRFTPSAWAAQGVGFAGNVAEGAQVARTVRCETAFGHDRLDGGASERYGDWSGGTNESRLNIPFVAATFLLRPYTYPGGGTPEAWAGLTDPFDTAASLTNYTATGAPAVEGGQLVLDGGDKVQRPGRVDLTGRALVVDLEHDATTEGNSLQVSLTDAEIGGSGRVAVALATGRIDDNGPVVTFTLLDEGFGESYAVIRVSPATRYWRLREENGMVVCDFSGDGQTWRTGTYTSHTLLADQLASLRLTITCSGTAQARIGAVNPGGTSTGPAVLPMASTYSFMGAAPALRETWHGRDVLMGVVDQGSSAAVRTAQNITLVKRRYHYPVPPGGAETYPGAVHGCLVAVCAVPTGGRLVEAVVFDGSEYTTIGVVMAGIRWCVEQGARVVNVSIGGGGDHPVIAATLGYIDANYDAEIYIAAGNDGQVGISLPAAYSTVFSSVHSVGAIDEHTNTLASFSNHHELLSGVAPGANTGGRLPNGTAVTWNGTSAAAPHAANLCARAQTARRWTAGQAGAAMDRNARPTGAPRSEEGGGAYDLARALAVIGDPIGTSNVPAVAMPRFSLGQTHGVVAGFEQMARAVELQGALCVVRYTPVDANGLTTWAGLPTGFRALIEWTHSDVDSIGGVWDPAVPVLMAPADGMYLAVLHVRFGTWLVDDTYATGGAYAVGSRTASLMLNGTDPAANLVVADTQPALAGSEGMTCVAAAILPMYTNDWIFADILQTSGSTVQCLQPDSGGTWLALARLSPLAPAA